jgi:NAD dependent epimerase/dehydratase family enzyme
MNTEETKGFLADVSRAWELATSPITMKNNNNNNVGLIIQMRFDVVQSKLGSALSKL